MHLYCNSSKTTIDIKKFKQLLGNKLTQSILAIHAFCGCNTTSRLHSVRSRRVLQKIWKSQEFQNLLMIFSLPLSDRKDILQAGEKILLLLLSGKWEKTFDVLRVHKYHEKISRQTQHSVKIETLGPIQMLHNNMCFRYIIRYSTGEKTMRCIS